MWDRLLRMCRLTDTILMACEIPAIHPTGQPEYDAMSETWIEEANAEMPHWCSMNGVTFIGDLYKPFAVNPGLLADGIHPNNDGNRVIAKAVHRVLGQPLPYNG
jgi:lysophospholipase L1-like esterase